MAKYTVLITSYNSEKHIYNCVDSALKIKFDDFEIIVSDNNSSDNTLKILDKFKKKIILKNHYITLDKTNSWNRAYSYASNSNFILTLHSDAIIHPNCLNLYNQYADKRVSAIFGLNYSQKFFYPFPYTISKNYPKIGLMGSGVNILGSIMNTNLFKRVNMWPLGHDQNQDTELWLRISQLGEIIYLPKYVVSSSSEEQNISLVRNNVKKKFIYFLITYKDKKYISFRRNILNSIFYYMNCCKKYDINSLEILKDYDLNFLNKDIKKKIFFEKLYVIFYKIIGTFNFFLNNFLKFT
jgi:glycosyltransferase involved in cell wall biosynthesis